MEQVRKKARLFLCLAIALMLISGIVVSLIQTGGGKITMKELTIETDEGYEMSAYLLVPDTATKDTPAPAVVTSHGYLNNKEMTDANYVELARRGYVVLAIDQPDHGDSEVTKDFNIIQPTGVYQGVLAVSRLPYVDKTKIGVTGHSMGSWSVTQAVNADNEADEQLISAVLIHCNDPVYADNEGKYVNIYGSRDVGLISAEYDEFFNTSTAKDGSTLQSPYYMDSANAQSFLYFGTDPEGKEKREAFTYYTENINGKEAVRVTFRPSIIHPWSHFSARSESYVCDFFQKTLGAPNAIDSNNQIWQWKEAFNFIGLIGLGMFVCALALLLAYTTPFRSLLNETSVLPVKVADGKGYAWFWGSLIVCGILSTCVYLPIVAFGNSQAVAQGESLGIGLWSTACGIITIISMLLYYKLYGKKHGMDLSERGVKMPVKQIALSILLGLIVAIAAYMCVFLDHYFFLADFRLWTLAIKAFKAPILKYLPYGVLFLTYYFAQSVAANAFNYNTIGRSWGNAIIVSLFAAFPAFVLPWIQYIHYYTTKSMMWNQPTMASPNYPMYVLWLFPIVLVLIGTTLISRVIYKHTKNPYIAGAINAIIVTVFTITNTCTVFM